MAVVVVVTMKAEKYLNVMQLHSNDHWGGADVQQVLFNYALCIKSVMCSQ